MNQSTADYVKALNAFGSGESRNCPMCQVPVEGIRLYEKIEPEMYSLYVEPCNHRLGLWSGAPDWVKTAGLSITIIELDY